MQLPPHALQLVLILNELGGVVHGMAARTDGIGHNGYAGSGPETKELTSCFYVGIVEDATGHVVQLTLVDDGRARRTIGVVVGLGVTVAGIVRVALAVGASIGLVVKIEEGHGGISRVSV